MNRKSKSCLKPTFIFNKKIISNNKYLDIPFPHAIDESTPIVTPKSPIQNPQIDSQPVTYENLLQDCEEGNTEGIKKKHQQDPAKVLEHLTHTPLHSPSLSEIARLSGHKELAEFLENIIDTPSQYQKRLTDAQVFENLCIACTEFYDTTIQRLACIHRARPDLFLRVTDDGDTLLHLAIRSKNHKVVTFLLKHRIGVNKPNNEGETALHLAVSMEEERLVRQLLEKNESMAVKNQASQFPLDIAIQKQDLVISKLLVKYLITEIIQHFNDCEANDFESPTQAFQSFNRRFNSSLKDKINHQSIDSQFFKDHFVLSLTPTNCIGSQKGDVYLTLIAYPDSTFCGITCSETWVLS